MSKVYLIGAGPGDEELLTLKGKRILEKCTAVLYDRLANDSLLKYLNKECKIYYCGKEPGCHYKNQEETNDMLVKLAKEGNTVGRIKGGDPYVFGRGGEEALRLENEGIEFEVIPGITSAIAVLNYAGIPVTHRAISQSFHVFTGHTADKLDINWKSVASLNGTLIFLMGLKNIGVITNSLINNSKDAECPCAVIMRGSTSKQKKVVGTLSNICSKVEEAGFKSPCIIVVGGVVELSEKLNWYERKPLFGKNICITRSKQQSVEISEKLLDLGAQITAINSIEIKDTAKNLKEYIKKFSSYDYLVLTSVNGVNLFFKYLKDNELDIRKIGGEFCAIGPATAKAIKNMGINPLIIAEQFVSESLLTELKNHVKPGDKILIPGSKNAREYLGEELRKLDCCVDEVPIYEIGQGTLQNEGVFDNVDIVIFTSPSTVKNMISMLGINRIKEKECIAIGLITGEELSKNNIKYSVCDEYSSNGIIKNLLQLKGEKHD
ncbi:uroporphyrinogen-III C-methyltransferase [Clostridium bowmanii]|uniref:uroporphyrinogen-III C-methyltransferase n=1 Tax=Clostridium bowmanii TaxID=132925 RepID=UPI001C0CD799|nr:uroporphyrinogen-III C-methyltransferase [Clostridium bowmanii]MBU3190243.1 uroporphyrinogen-III C-methyltransferase [Clostridium bowmanii]MCA1074782.1 uroporphyrinogen-III C-methyltransferase [Clostridium bowmanii]